MERVTYLDPLSEILATGQKNYSVCAKAICDYLEGHGDRQSYFDSVSTLLADPSYYRLVLYLPFYFPEDQENYKRTYLKTWRKLTATPDPRANFCTGLLNLLEKTKDTDNYVIKAFHLIPWLRFFGWISLKELTDFVADAILFHRDSVRAKSILEAVYFCSNFDIITPGDFMSFRPFEHLVRSQIPETDEANIAAWHNNAKFPADDLKPKHLEHLQPALENLAPYINTLPIPRSEDEYYLVHNRHVFRGTFGHSPICFSENNGPINLAHPSNSHLLLNSIWYGLSKPKIENLRTRLTNFIFSLGPEHQHTTFLKLEQDLISTLLATWSFPDFEFKSSILDAPSPFYDSCFRKIATELFVTHIFLPKVDKSNRDPF